MTVKFSDKINAVSTVSAAAKTAAPPKTETVRDLCIAAGIPEQANGRIPIAALDKRLAILGWDANRRMVWKEKAHRLGIID
jgi:hypothetical protein